MSTTKLTRRLTVYLSRDEELELEQLVRDTKSSKAALGLKAIRKLLDDACRGEQRTQSG